MDILKIGFSYPFPDKKVSLKGSHSMNILLCQHGGSGNHGCEALARTAEMLLRKAFPP